MPKAKEQQLPAHSVLPWRAEVGERLSDGSDCWVIDSEENSICEMMCPADVEEANARFIERAVNNHKDLVRWLSTMACPECRVHMSYETYKGCAHCQDARNALATLGHWRT